ncbi:MAG: KGK domain-containing protein [Cyanobacteriota bacterium]
MEYNSYLQECSDDDVLSFDDAIFKVGKVKNAVEYAFTDPNQLPQSLSYAFRNKGLETLNISNIISDGVDCEVLRIGSKGWEKGKLRIRIQVEFCSDEPDISQPESPLDDLRQMINQETQQ